MPHNPLVSICIPSYNHACFLPEAIESALNQTYPHIEIVIVDDNSKDNSLEIAKSYELKNPSKISVFMHPDQSNRGISATANLAFNKSKGIYWSGLPSDDVLCPDKIEKQVAFLEKNPDCGLVYGYSRCMNEKGEKLPGILGEDISKALRKTEIMIQRNCVPGLTALVRRTCIENIGLHDDSLIYSDWEFWIRIFAHFKIGFIDRPLAMSRIHPKSTSHAAKPEAEREYVISFLKALRQKASNIGGTLVDPRNQALIELQLSYHYFCTGNRLDAADNLVSAFRTDPSLKEDKNFFCHWLRSRHMDHYQPLQPYFGADSFGLWAHRQLLGVVEDTFRKRVKKSAAAIQFFVAASNLYQLKRTSASRKMFIQCLLKEPAWLGEKGFQAMLGETLLGPKIFQQIRNAKKWLYKNKSALDNG